MRKELTRHHLYYFFLLGFFVVSLVSAYIFFNTKQLLMVLTVGVTCWYILSASIHHKLEHDLHLKVFLEYVMIGSLGIAVLFFLIRFLV